MGFKPRKMTVATMIKRKLAAGPTRDDLVLALDDDFEIFTNRKTNPLDKTPNPQLPYLSNKPSHHVLNKSDSQPAADFLNSAVVTIQNSKMEMPVYKRKEMSEEQKVELQLKQLIDQLKGFVDTH